MEKRLTGILGEKLVCKWYTEHKYRLLAVNYKIRQGEIDVIAQNKNTVVFVEVKTRKSDRFSSAKEAVTFAKQQRIKAAASRFLAANNMEDMFVRFDVAEVYHPENNPVINIIENAFE